MNKLGVSWANLNCVKTHENYIGSVKDEILLILTNVAMTYVDRTNVTVTVAIC